jgi:hypothetical protein
LLSSSIGVFGFLLVLFQLSRMPTGCMAQIKMCVQFLDNCQRLNFSHENKTNKSTSLFTCIRFDFGCC